MVNQAPKITNGKLLDGSSASKYQRSKPVKATMSYGLKFIGYEDRSRQSQNRLN